jgi:hypothetical protein
VCLNQTAELLGRVLPGADFAHVRPYSAQNDIGSAGLYARVMRTDRCAPLNGFDCTGNADDLGNVSDLREDDAVWRIHISSTMASHGGALVGGKRIFAAEILTHPPQSCAAKGPDSGTESVIRSAGGSECSRRRVTHEPNCG